MSDLGALLKAAGVHVQRFNENGPAEGATSPSHGSINIDEDMDMNMHTNSTATPEGQTETRDVGDAIDIIANALKLNELVYMAGDSLWHDGSKLQGEAIMIGVGAIRDKLLDATAILYTNIGQGGAS